MISSPLVAPRLVGRDDECAFLMRRLDAVLQHGAASLTFVEGEAGMGKTRLLAELRRRANELHALVLDAHALEHVREPYAPFVLAVERAAETAPRAVAEDLRAIATALDPDVAQHKAKRLRAVAAALRRIMRERAVAIFVEDAHWADRASLDLLGFFAVELAASPLFVVATQRPSDTPADLAGALRTGAHTVRLGPLADRDVATLLREALRDRGRVPPDRLRRITQLAGGNPLFALELLRNALAGAPDDVAPAIAYPIMQRWESMDRTARDVLAAAAAGGIDVELVARAVDRSVEEVEDALERARALHLVELERGTGRWRFQHALTRAAIEAAIAPRSQPAIHRRIGELLEARGENVEPARLAYHWSFADDAERSARYNEAAGDRAVALHDYVSALRFFETAARSVPAGAAAARLNEKLASAAMIEALPSRASDAIAAGLRAYTELGDARGAARMEMHRSRCAWFEGDPAGSVAAAERALALAEPLGPSAELFDIHVRLAQFHQQVSNRPDAARRAIDAAATMRDVAAPDAVIRFLNARGMMRAGDWQLDAFVRDYEEAIEIAERIGHVELLVSTQNNLALNALLTGLPAVAIPALEASIATSYEFGLGWHVPNELLSLARVRYVSGDVTGARQAMSDALASTYEARRLDIWIAAYGIPIALAAQDDALLARCTSTAVLDSALASGDAWAIALVVCAHADLAHERGDAAGARDVVLRGLDALGGDARPLQLCAYAARYGRDEDLPRARALLAAPAHDRSRAAERALFDAHVAARRRRRAESAQHALEAAQIYGELHYVLLQAHALELAGRESDALRIYRAAGSARDVARVEMSSRAADPLAPLTPREREIAQLVLGGRSNREAGELLGLSERTVGNHLQSVFNRLGIGSRRELADVVGAARPE